MVIEKENVFLFFKEVLMINECYCKLLYFRMFFLVNFLLLLGSFLKELKYVIIKEKFYFMKLNNMYVICVFVENMCIVIY